MPLLLIFFFFNDTATTEIYTLSLHDALPICMASITTRSQHFMRDESPNVIDGRDASSSPAGMLKRKAWMFCSKRSEEHTSELQSRLHLVCRLLLEKKKKSQNHGVFTI